MTYGSKIIEYKAGDMDALIAIFRRTISISQTLRAALNAELFEGMPLEERVIFMCETLEALN